MSFKRLSLNSVLLKRILRLTLLLLCFWILLSSLLLLFANKLIFRSEYSTGQIKSRYDFEEIFITYKDGNKSEKLYITQSFSKKDDPYVVLFFHGNGGLVGRVINALAPFRNIVAPSYPGYHLSSGKSTEDGVYKTVDLSMKYLLDQGFKEENIIIFGASLGGAAALWAAKNYPGVKRVIIVGTFDKIKSVCKDLYSVFCVFSGGIFDNNRLASQSYAKIRQFHSLEDKIIKYEFAQELFANIASDDKIFYPISGGHNDFFAEKLIDKSLER